MSEVLAAIFMNHRPKDATANDLVFSSRKGTPLQSENILKRIIHPACERLKLPKVGWHTLRHTTATLLHEHEPLRVAQAILGHSDLQTTLGYTVNGFPRMVFPYSMFDLPPNAMKEVQRWYDSASSRVPAVKAR